MQKRDSEKRFGRAGALGGLALLPMLLTAHSYGPPPGVTAAPGDDPRACTSCHGGTALNAGGGKVEILLAGDTTYTPGVKQHITIRVTDDPQRRWGFQFSARLASDPANKQAGNLVSTNTFTQVYCANYTPSPTGTPLPCAAGAIQYISHVTAGTRANTAGPTTFDFDWAPPDTDSGPVTLYVAGNAANSNSSLTGDHIYTSNVTLTPVAAAKPNLKSDGVASSASLKASPASPNSWLTLYGTNLASSTRQWRGDDIKNGALPTSLDGVSVNVNGKAAYVEYVSPTQINILTPDDSSTGPVQIQVTTVGGTADPVSVTLQKTAPAFFTFDGKYLAATHVDGTLIGAPGFFASAPAATTPAKPGETIVLYGSGFGVTNPVVAASQLVTQVSPLAATDFAVRIGGVNALVGFAGLIPGNAGLYQFNVQVPTTAVDGDLGVTASVGGVTSPVGTVTVKK